MGITKTNNEKLSKSLYNEILIMTAELCEKEVPADLTAAILTGPTVKHPNFMCTFIMGLVELSGRSLASIIKIYAKDDPKIASAEWRWRAYYKAHKELQKDVAILCMMVREKYCTNNKQDE